MAIQAGDIGDGQRQHALAAALVIQLLEHVAGAGALHRKAAHEPVAHRLHLGAAGRGRRGAGIGSLLRQRGAGGEQEAGKGAYQDMFHLHRHSLQNHHDAGSRGRPRASAGTPRRRRAWPATWPWRGPGFTIVVMRGGKALEREVQARRSCRLSATILILASGPDLASASTMRIVHRHLDKTAVAVAHAVFQDRRGDSCRSGSSAPWEWRLPAAR